MPDFNPPKYSPGDVLKADMVNQINDALRDARKIRIGSGLAARYGAGGLQITAVPGQATFYIGKADGNITARSGTTPGTGTAEDWDASSGTLTATGVTRTVKNAGTLISSGKYVAYQKDPFGVWWAAPLECES